MFKKIASFALVIMISLNAAQKNEKKIKLPSKEVLEKRLEVDFDDFVRHTSMVQDLAEKELQLDEINEIIFKPVFFVSLLVAPNGIDEEICEKIFKELYKVILKDNQEAYDDALVQLRENAKKLCSKENLDKVYREFDK